jgi:hypothetical protein
MLALCSLSAQAAFQSGVTIKLLAPGGINGSPPDPTPIDETASVALANLGTGLVQGDPSNQITGYWMLPGETIFFDSSTNSILLHIAGGWDDGTTITTGYLSSGGNRARYEISGLDIGAAITGFNAYDFTGYGTSGVTGLAGPSNPASYIQLSGSTLSFDLDTLSFLRPPTGSGFAFAEFRIDLLTQGSGGGGDNGGGNNLPEPATLALLAIAALGARAARRHA